MHRDSWADVYNVIWEIPDKIERKGFVYEEDIIVNGFKCRGFCWVC